MRPEELTGVELACMRRLVVAVEALLDLPIARVEHILDCAKVYGTDADGGLNTDHAVEACLGAIVDNHGFGR
jgi:hypothetical protein